MRCLERVLTAAILVAVPICVLAQGTTAAPEQNSAATATSIDRITFLGADAYSDSDLLHVVRLHTGDTVTQPMITAAAQSLYDTGLFTDVNAGFDYTDGVHTLIFHLKPVPDDQLLHVSFANLIWFTQDELNAAVHKAIPIYQGKIADQSKFVDQIQAILVKLLAGRFRPCSAIALWMRRVSIRIARWSSAWWTRRFAWSAWTSLVVPLRWSMPR